MSWSGPPHVPEGVAGWRVVLPQTVRFKDRWSVRNIMGQIQPKEEAHDAPDSLVRRMPAEVHGARRHVDMQVNSLTRLDVTRRREIERKEEVVSPSRTALPPLFLLFLISASSQSKSFLPHPATDAFLPAAISF